MFIIYENATSHTSQEHTVPYILQLKDLSVVSVSEAIAPKKVK